MQILENWDPLNLPRGSVRALMTLAVLGVVWTLMALEREIPPALAFAAILITGHYLGSRTAPKREGAREPLYLPRGSVRFLITAGFVAVGYLLWNRGTLDLSFTTTASALLVFAAALIAGFVFRRLLELLSGGKPNAPRRWLENLKAVIVLIAATALCIVSLVPDLEQRELVTLVSAPLVAFYFGSRS